MQSNSLDILDFCLINLFHLVPPHNHSCHHEETAVGQKYHNHWNYQGPHKFGLWVQVAAANNMNGNINNNINIVQTVYQLSTYVN